MFFKMSMYINKQYQASSAPGMPGNVPNSVNDLDGGQITVWVNTDEIKRVGTTGQGYQFFIEFKSAPIPYCSQTLFVYRSGSPEWNSLKEMTAYIDGTERF